MKSLEALGHKVQRLQETEANSAQIARACKNVDLFVWVHTHGFHTPDIEPALAIATKRGIPVITYHLDLWKGLEREKDMQTDPYWSVLTDFFTCDKLMAEHLTENTKIKGHYLPPGVFGEECYMAKPSRSFDTVFVGSYGY